MRTDLIARANDQLAPVVRRVSGHLPTGLLPKAAPPSRRRFGLVLFGAGCVVGAGGALLAKALATPIPEALAPVDPLPVEPHRVSADGTVDLTKVGDIPADDVVTKDVPVG